MESSASPKLEVEICLVIAGYTLGSIPSFQLGPPLQLAREMPPRAGGPLPIRSAWLLTTATLGLERTGDPEMKEGIGTSLGHGTSLDATMTAGNTLPSLGIMVPLGKPGAGANTTGQLTGVQGHDQHMPALSSQGILGHV